MYSVREIIKEACTRANLVPRRQAVPGSLSETAYNLLKGLVSKLNNDNYLAFTQQTVELPMRASIHIYDEHDSMIPKNCMVFGSVAEMEAHTLSIEEIGFYAMVSGILDTYWTVENDLIEGPTFVSHPVQDPVGYEVQEMTKYIEMYQFHCPDVSKINTLTIYVKNSKTPVTYEMAFVPYDKFDRYGPAEAVFTYSEKAEGEWVVLIKKNIAQMQGYGMRLNYNRALDFDIDDDLMVPESYIELLITCLTHKLALQFPRLDEAQMNRLELDMRSMLENVKTPKADTREVLRDCGDWGRGQMTQYELLGGVGIYR